MYAKQHYPKPKFSDEAMMMLSRYYVGVRKRFGSPRIRETIFRIAQNMARLKLKDMVDEVDAYQTMQYYNIILQQMELVVVAVSRNPREEAYEQCLDILMESTFPIRFEELVKKACERNPQVSKYIGKMFKLQHNKRLRPILEMLLNHSRIKEVQMKPEVLQYIQDGEAEGEIMVKAPKQASDPYDPYDLDPESVQKNDQGTCSGTEIPCRGGDQKHEDKKILQTLKTRSYRSYRSYRSDSSLKPLENSSSPYAHLILVEHLPNLKQTAYYCKEHPSVPCYYDLEGIEESHFKPFHDKHEA
jgi:hypothetical protein